MPAHTSGGLGSFTQKAAKLAKPDKVKAVKLVLKAKISKRGAGSGK